MLKLVPFLIFILLSCGKVDQTNDNFDKTNDNISKTNDNISVASDLLGDVVGLIQNGKVLVFKRDFISPDNISLKPKLLKIKTNKDIGFITIDTSTLRTFINPLDGETYYLVPERIASALSYEDFTQQLYVEGSLWAEVYGLVGGAIVQIQEVFINTLLENEEYLVSLMARGHDLIRLKECPLLLEQWGWLTGEVERIKFYQLKYAREKKLRKKELLQLEGNINFRKCQELRDTSTFSSLERVIEVQVKLAKDWKEFKGSWDKYYINWKTLNPIEFTSQLNAGITLPVIEDFKVLGLHKSLRESYAQQMSYLWVVKGRLLNSGFDSFKQFILSKAASGLEIDPVNPFSFSELSDEEFEIIRQFFERALYSANSKKEAKAFRLFISDAVFVMYERQLIQRKIVRTLKKLKVESQN